MYNKVEVTGVNTGSLKVLTEAEKMRLLKELQEGRLEARDELVNGNLRLVLSIVQRFAGRGENPDDLFQVGCIGLIKAIDHFDLSVGVRFSTYAVPLIIGEIRRFLRDSSVVRVSRSLRDVAYRAMQAKERLQQELSRDPTVDELAKEIGLPREEVVMALDAITEPVSLYEPLYADSGDAVYVLDQIGGNENDRDWLEELALKDAIRALPEREKTILHLRFFVGLTQMEVSRAIGISQAQVSRLEKGALTKIKSRL
ncbi:MAG: RNA polymerase sporulation sigma factor SigG [Clostridia bacterium]|nr:RNA polymerase sporulation sigma factor SigG [Clostridia bacterium]